LAIDTIRKSDQLNKGWAQNVAAGRVQRGNLEVNLRFLDEVGLPRPGQQVLEVGCGIGTVTQCLAEKGFHVIGTDLSQTAIDYGLEKYPGLKLQTAEAEKLPFEDERFDCVISFDLFEHVEAIDDHVAEVGRVLRSGGHYLLGTPNKYCSALFDTLRHRGFGWRVHHPSLHTWRQLRRRLERHGFVCRFIKMNTVTDFTLKKLKAYGVLADLARHVDTAGLPLGLQSNLYVIAEKRG
jgi:2-polyprenyl-3-methyl-5-hydroxy-6-metoxy-1,4-benzoquinol methylase